ncbi:MAG: NYN domain-containing protein [Caldimonas sp.]
MIEKQPRIALLIDADNSPSSKIDVILAELAKVGVTNIRRAYGNWKKDGLKGWEGVLHEYAIRPIQQFDYSKGKNATDMGMVIDAMDLLYTDQPEAFGIVSSDSDFTPLVMHLKAKGAQVYGFGAKKTPMPFVNACSRFLYLENLGRTVAETEVKAVAPRSAPRSPRRSPREVTVAEPESTTLEPPSESPQLRLDSIALRRDARIVSLLRNAVENAAGEDGWSPLGSVGQQIGNQASFDPRNYGYRKLIDLIDASQLFELDRRGSQVVLRDKRQSRTGSPEPGARRSPRGRARRDDGEAPLLVATEGPNSSDDKSKGGP